MFNLDWYRSTYRMLSKLLHAKVLASSPLMYSGMIINRDPLVGAVTIVVLASSVHQLCLQARLIG